MKSGYLFAWLGMLMLLAITCQAQPQRGRNRGYVRLSRDTLFRLLEMPPVRKELELRKLQIDMLDDLQADLGQQRRAAFFSGGPLELPGGRRGPEGSGQALQDGLDKMQAEVEKIRVQGEKLVTVILDSGQTNRLAAGARFDSECVARMLLQSGQLELVREIPLRIDIVPVGFLPVIHTLALVQHSYFPSSSRNRIT